jgi:hypothetical protein
VKLVLRFSMIWLERVATKVRVRRAGLVLSVRVGNEVIGVRILVEMLIYVIFGRLERVFKRCLIEVVRLKG